MYAGECKIIYDNLSIEELYTELGKLYYWFSTSHITSDNERNENEYHLDYITELITFR